jgi:superfamily I DNA and/or RNA helicase
MLREHFRCVPPIIAYSNRQFYNGAIVPLRIAKGSERIDPPLVDICVAGGMREARIVNNLEAQAIAAEIECILGNDHFANRSLGVVSLLGMAQAKHIDSVVRARCDASELHRRKFVCGEARSFQGSERDIIFLSMVASPGSAHALSGNMHEQRLNVAASRAKDRMYLVRSVEMADLSDADLRKKLLAHFHRPLVADTAAATTLIVTVRSGPSRLPYAMC